jgi:proliferating cell nuclear antigen
MSAKMILSPNIARQFINSVGAIMDEFGLQISKDGWKVSAVDKANVAMVNINLPKDSFQNYEFGSDTYTSSIDGRPTGVLEENIAVGIDVEEIKKFFGGMKKTEIVLDEELHAPVEFRFNMAPEKHCGRYQLELNQGMFYRKILLLPETVLRRSPKIPDGIPFDYKMHLNTLEFQRIVKKAAEISDYIYLGFRHEIIREMTDDPERHKEKHTITFIASTVDGDEFPWEGTKQIHNWQALRDNARDSSSSLFSLDYLLDITEKLPDKVWLHIGQNMPCIISFGLGQTGTVEYWLAPRIESE